jgi:putative spermidine/putrescine transport system permease protein
MALLGALAMTILIGPVLIVLAISVTAEASLRFPPEGFSLRWYATLADPAQSRHIHAAALNSLWVAAAAAGLATLAAGAAALWLRTRQGAFGRGADIAFMSPLVLPMLSFGLAALIVLTMLRERPSLFWLSMGHLVVVAPYVLRTASASLSQLSQSLLDSSASLGASRFYTFRRITLPILAPGLAAGAFLAFMASLDNVPVSLFLSGARSDMLPIRLWGMMESSLDVRVAAASGVLVLGTTALLLLMNRLVGLGRRMSG